PALELLEQPTPADAYRDAARYPCCRHGIHWRRPVHTTTLDAMAFGRHGAGVRLSHTGTRLALLVAWARLRPAAAPEIPRRPRSDLLSRPRRDEVADGRPHRRAVDPRRAADRSRRTGVPASARHRGLCSAPGWPCRQHRGARGRRNALPRGTRCAVR